MADWKEFATPYVDRVIADLDMTRMVLVLAALGDLAGCTGDAMAELAEARLALAPQEVQDWWSAECDVCEFDMSRPPVQ